MAKEEKQKKEVENTTILENEIPEVKVDDTKKAEEDKEQYITKLNDDLSEQKKKADEYFEHLKRNMAEFDNFKKRMNKEKESMYSVVISDIILAILPIMDNFEKAMEVETTDTSYKEGITMIYNQLSDYLSAQGLEEIEALNKTFDPNLHEAVMHEENKDFGEKEIIQVFRKGYKLGAKVVRHTMVKVAN